MAAIASPFSTECGTSPGEPSANAFDYEVKVLLLLAAARIQIKMAERQRRKVKVALATTLRNGQGYCIFQTLARIGAPRGEPTNGMSSAGSPGLAATQKCLANGLRAATSAPVQENAGRLGTLRRGDDFPSPPADRCHLPGDPPGTRSRTRKRSGRPPKGVRRRCSSPNSDTPPQRSTHPSAPQLSSGRPNSPYFPAISRPAGAVARR
jgi:hypothetical protein